MVIYIPLNYCREGVCLGRVLNQHHWDNFFKYASYHTLTTLQLIHNDLCGALPFDYFYMFKYFNFIDDFTIHTWVYFLKLKSEFFDKFLAYKALIENQSRHQINKLRTNNGV